MARKWVHWTNEKLVIFSIKPSSHPFWEINSFDHTQILHTQHPDDRSLDAQRAESTRLRPFCGLGRGRFTERIDATRSLSAYLTNNYTPAKSQKLKLLYAIKPDCRHIFDADVRNATMCDTSNSQKQQTLIESAQMAVTSRWATPFHLRWRRLLQSPSAKMKTVKSAEYDGILSTNGHNIWLGMDGHGISSRRWI